MINHKKTATSIFRRVRLVLRSEARLRGVTISRPACSSLTRGLRLLCAAALVLFGACAGMRSPDSGTAASSAEPQPPRFVRHWEPFVRTSVLGAYVSVTARDGQLEVWHAVSREAGGVDDRSQSVDALAVRRGPALDRLGEVQVVLRMADLIDDVSRMDGKPGLEPRRAFSRAFVMHDDEIGYVGLVCSYPEYGRYLHPALIVSETGDPGTWRYLGKLTGEPADEIATGRKVWSDGGSIMRLTDGRWRIYTNGYGEWNGLAAMEADSLSGPWRFLRDSDGKVRMLTPDIPGLGLGIFPNVLRVHALEWHLWMSDRWIPHAIWHFTSTDGLDWRVYGRQPEIMRDDHEDYIKCMRAFLMPGGECIIGMLSVTMRDTVASRPSPWIMHWSRMPVGLEP